MLRRGAPTTTRAWKPIFCCAPCASTNGRTRLRPSGVQQCAAMNGAQEWKSCCALCLKYGSRRPV